MYFFLRINISDFIWF